MRLRAPVAVALATLTLLGTAALAGSPSAPAPATAAAYAVRGIPEGAPPAAYASEPAIPAPTGWPFPEAFPRTSGTGRLAGGASYWTDFVYDDHGAMGLTVGRPVAGLAPPAGTYTYPDGPARGNGADIFRAAVGLTRDASYWRVDWTTLADPRVPIAEWALATSGSATGPAIDWPGGAGVRSPAVDLALLVSARGARVVKVPSGVTVATLPVTVDRSTQSFVVRVPRSQLPVTGSWTVRLAAGLADASGTAFAPVSPSEGAAPSEPAVYNVAFRSAAQETASCGTCGRPDVTGVDRGARTIDENMWNENAQASVLQRGDVTPFALPVRWADLAQRRGTAEPQPTGTSTRWYVTPLHLGQGVVPDSGGFRGSAGDLRPNFLSRVQPYTVFVPTSYKRGTPAPLTWVLHSLGVNHNQYASLSPRFLERLCEDRHSICATTLGFGADGWYFDEAEVDFWSVWHQLASTYTLDPRRTIISGYSMGGYASYKLGLTYPDLFAAAMPFAGPPTCGIRVSGDLREGATPGRCTDDGDTQVLVGNARWLPYDIADGVVDELVPYTSVREQIAAFAAAGLRYRFATYPTEDHLVYSLQDGFSEEVAALGHPVVVRDPGTIAYTWYPDGSDPALGLGPTGAYWVRNLVARTTAPGVVASVAADSKMRPSQAHDVTTSTSPTVPGDPTPSVVQTAAWEPRGVVPAAAPVLVLKVRNVASLTVDMIRAGFRTGQQARVTTDSDGPVTLTLRGLAPNTVVRSAGAVSHADGHGTAVVHVAAGPGTVLVG